MPRCVACLQGDFHECRVEGKCGSVDDELGLDGFSNLSESIHSGVSNSPVVGESKADDIREGNETEEEVPEFRTYKDDSSLRDQQSTGRKRAAKMYPLSEDQPCEWQMRRNCGGGKFPIVGCLNGLQNARHHGPDKNTLNNEQGNVHRICHNCHNRWHTLNDPDYVWSAIYDQHNPISASVVDVALNEEWWDGRKLVKAKD